MEDVARYDYVYNRNNKNFKDNTKRVTDGKKSARNLIYLVSSCIFFESKTDVCFGFEADAVVSLGLKKNRFACSKISSSISAMLFALIFARAQRASTFDISAEGNVWLQSPLRSFAMICDDIETALLRSSAIVCDHMKTSL